MTLCPNITEEIKLQGKIFSFVNILSRQVLEFPIWLQKYNYFWNFWRHVVILNKFSPVNLVFHWDILVSPLHSRILISVLYSKS